MNGSECLMSMDESVADMDNNSWQSVFIVSFGCFCGTFTWPFKIFVLWD